jgi:hypothetical protein
MTDEKITMVQLPPGMKDLTTLYLVKITMPKNAAVVVAFDREDADASKKELESYFSPKRLEILGPFTMR